MITKIVTVLVLVYKSFATLYVFMVMQIKLAVVVKTGTPKKSTGIYNRSNDLAFPSPNLFFLSFVHQFYYCPQSESLKKPFSLMFCDFTQSILQC